MQPRAAIFTALIALSLQGCGWQQELAGRATDIVESGVSVGGLTQAVWLAAARPGLSVAGKDYLFVGPMDVNREGTRRSYLWFAISTTIDRQLTGAPKRTLNTVVLMVDNIPMTFDLTPWDKSADSSPYSIPFASDASYAARITDSQIRQLARADALRAYVVDADGRSPVFNVVGGDRKKWLAGGLR